eukprot:Sdes_comp20576_c0_seq1m15478
MSSGLGLGDSFLSQDSTTLQSQLWALGCLGFVQSVATLPFDTLAVRLQYNAVPRHGFQSFSYEGLRDCFSKTVQREGRRALYKGFTATSAGNSLLAPVHTCIYSVYSRHSSSEYRSGFVAGAFGSLICTPFEHVKVKLQLQRETVTRSDLSKSLFSSSWDCFRKIIRHHGFSSLYSGFFPVLIRDAHGYGLLFSTYQGVKSRLGLNPGSSPAPHQVAFSGVCAGLAFWFATYPLDIIKSWIQGDSIPRRSYHGIFDCSKLFFLTQGASGVFRGAFPSLLRALPASALFFLWLENLKII